MKKIDTVIFDWAGTTIDFGCFAPLAAFLDVFRSYKIEITLEEARAPMGMKKLDHVKAILSTPRISDEWIRHHGSPFTEQHVKEVYHEFEKSIFQGLKEYCDPLPGVREVVGHLKEEGIKIGSTTGYTREMMEIVAPEAENRGYSPDSLVTSTDVPEGRPFPYMIWKNAIDLDSPALSGICKVGDTVSDIQEGVNAGVWSIGVVIGSSEWGMSEEETGRLPRDKRSELVAGITQKFLSAGAHFVIAEIGELPDLFDVINSRLAHGRVPG